jgi:hypothetical protein
LSRLKIDFASFYSLPPLDRDLVQLGETSPMFDSETTALLRAVLNEVCESVSKYETGARAHVASKLLEAATRGQTSAEDLKRIC